MYCIYLLCGASNMYGVNPGGQKASLPRLIAGARGVLATE